MSGHLGTAGLDKNYTYPNQVLTKPSGISRESRLTNVLGIKLILARVLLKLINGRR